MPAPAQTAAVDTMNAVLLPLVLTGTEQNYRFTSKSTNPNRTVELVCATDDWIYSDASGGNQHPVTAGVPFVVRITKPIVDIWVQSAGAGAKVLSPAVID